MSFRSYHAPRPPGKRYFHLPSSPPETRSAILRLQQLEDLIAPVAAVGVVSMNGVVGIDSALVRFDTDTPGTIASTTRVTGLVGGDVLVGIDVRPATGELFGLGSGSRLYRIDIGTGAATQIGPAFPTALSGTAFGFDFNPTVDRIRVTSNTGQNLRINPNAPATGFVTVDTPLAFFAGDASTPPDENAGTAPTVVGVAYTNNLPPPTPAPTPAPVTTLYGINIGTDQLVMIGGPDGEPPSPNGGTVFTVPGGFLGFNPTGATSFDVAPSADPFAPAFATNVGTTGATTLYAINLTTGAATAVGTVGTGLSLAGFSVLPPATGSGTLRLDASSYSLNENGVLTVRVVRVGGATGTVMVNYATADGTAKAGVDYVPVSGTLTFGTGVVSQNITIPAIPDLSGVAGDPSKTFTLTLSAPAGGGVLGTPASATVTISETAVPTAPPPPLAPPVTLPPPPAPVVTPQPGPFQLFAVGAGGGGGPAVNVYSVATGQLVRSFFAYDQGFTGGVQVATGDVNGDGYDDVITGVGAGGGPNVKVFDGRTGNLVVSFFAYESTFVGGVQVAAGDVNGDGFADIVTGTGDGGGARVQVFSGADLSVIQNFFAFESSFRGGVNVAAGNFNNDLFDDIATSPGAGGGPRVQLFDGNTLAVLGNYFAFDQASRAGVFLATGQFQNNGVTGVVAGTGVGEAAGLRAFAGTTATVAADLSSFVSGFGTGGVRVASKVSRVGDALVLAGSGSRVLTINQTTSTVAGDITPFAAGFNGGVFVG
jgi:hypothetical protein